LADRLHALFQPGEAGEQYYRLSEMESRQANELKEDAQRAAEESKAQAAREREERKEAKKLQAGSGRRRPRPNALAAASVAGGVGVEGRKHDAGGEESEGGTTSDDDEVPLSTRKRQRVDTTQVLGPALNPTDADNDAVSDMTCCFQSMYLLIICSS
jgi:hypothetical protein